MQRLNRSLLHPHDRYRSPEEIFSRIYENHHWGGPGEGYYSGHGSDEALARPYAEAVRNFICAKGIRSVIDLGCGDFRVGSLLQLDRVSYVGVDVVPKLIARNQAKYAREGVSFTCLNIVDDSLPQAELCLIRQVFQHLSNAQILSVLGKLHQYRFVIVTEHYPAPEVKGVVANKDKATDGETRIVDGSAVFLDLPPFNVKAGRLLIELEIPRGPARGDRFKTLVFENWTCASFARPQARPMRRWRRC